VTNALRLRRFAHKNEQAAAGPQATKGDLPMKKIVESKA
jgi:hypothetical protein